MLENLAGKTVLVTGATSGIGFEASVKLARQGAHVVLVGRDAKKSETAAEEARARSGSKAISSLPCNFASQQQIRALAAAFLEKHERLDVLINNAGTVSEHRQVTEDGIELTFAVNHLGYFLLTYLLLERIRASAPARIVNVSSIGHRKGATLDLDDIGFERGGYSIMGAYRRSKLANVLFTRELAKRLDPTQVTVNSLHPGAVATPIWAKAPWYTQPLLAVAKLFMISSEEGGDTLVYLAADDSVRGLTGGYYEKNKLRYPDRLAQREDLGQGLWALSEKLVGVRYPA